MVALTAELKSGQLDAAVKGSEDLLKRLGLTAQKTGQDIDKIGVGAGPRKAGQQIANTRTGMQRLGGEAKNAFGIVRKGFAGIGGGAKSFRGLIAGATTSLVSMRGAAIALVGGLSFGSVIGELRGFEATLGQIKGVTQASGDEMTKLSGLARDLGRTTQFSGKEAADGILFLARAGQDTNTIMQTLPPTLKLAQAGALELGEAADFATNIMGAFELSADKTEGSLNTLAVVANSSNTDIRSLASAISFAGLSANSAGVNLETTAAAVGVLGDVGISASRAGTSLNKILLDLSNTDPPDRVVEALQGMGLTIDDINPKAVGFERALINLRDAGIDLTAAAKLVGTEAAGSLLALTNNAAKVEELSAAARNNTDALDLMAAAMADNLDGAIKKASSALSGLILQIGASGGASLLQRAFEGIADAINFVTANLDAIGRPIRVAVGLFLDLIDKASTVGRVLLEAFGPQIRGLFDQATTGVQLLADNFDALQAPLQGIISAFTVLLALKVAAFGIGIVKSFVNPTTIAATAVGVLAGVLLDLSGVTLPDAIRAAAAFADKLIGFFIGLSRAGKEAFSRLADELAAPFISLLDLVSDVFQKLVGIFKKALEIGADIVGKFTRFLGRAFGEVGEIIGLETDADNLIPPSARRKFQDAATSISDKFESGLDFSGAQDAINPVVDSLEKLGSKGTASLSGLAAVTARADQAIEGLGTTSTLASEKTVTGIAAADDRLKQLNERIKETGKTAKDEFDDAKDAAEAFDTRVGSITGTFGQLFDELGTDVTQFSRNAETVANRLGGSLSNAFGRLNTGIGSALGLAEDQLGDFGGAVGVILDEIGIKGADVFNALGIDADSKFAKVAGGAFRVFGRFADGQLASLLAVGQNVFGSLSAVVSGIIPSITAFGGAAVSAFGSLTAAATTATVALGPIGLTFAAIAVAVLALILIFGDLRSALSFLADLFTKVGGDGSAAAIALQVAFAPVILPIVAIVETVRFLINLFRNLGDLGGTVAQVLGVVFAPVVLPILAIIEAVKFLIDLFSSLGSTGSTVSTILTVVLAPIVVPIRLIIEAVQFLIGVFGNLGNAVQIFGDIVRAIFNAITSVVRTFANLFTSLINGAIGAVTAVFRTFSGAVSGIFKGISSVVRSFAGFFSSVISGAVNVVTGVFRTFGNVVGGVFKAVSGAVKAFGKVLTQILKLIKAVVKEAKKLGSIKIPIPGGGKLVEGGKKLVKKGKKLLKKGKKKLKKLNPFADGGLINGPIDLAAPDGLTQPRFRSGGLLDDLTFLSDTTNVTPTRQLGIAGEAGPELIFPVTRNSQGDLAVKAIAPPQQQGQGGVTVVNKFVIDARGAGDEVIEELRAMVAETQRSVPVISAQTTAKMMRGVVRT